MFQLNLEVTEEQENGVRICKKSRFSLVDLAGSERQKDTNATGERLKEASVINKSLSALGNVINSLSTNESNVKPKHVHYRDSKLTFLLRDSLGGNSKTVLVATVTSVESCIAETMSTLKFAQRAKSIRNIVMRNEESTGTIAALQKEIVVLKARLSKLQDPTELDGRISLGRTSAALSSSAAAYEELIMQAELRYKALNEKFEASEKSGLGMKMTLKMRDSEVQRLKKTIGDTRDECGIMLKQNEEASRRIDELSTTIASLHRDIEERDEAAKCALGDVQRSGDEIIEQYKSKEAANREVYNKAMKDNMVLLKSSRELSAQAETLKQAFSAKEIEYENLQVEYSQLKEQYDLSAAAAADALADKDSTINEYMKRFNEAQETIINISAYSKHLAESNTTLTTAVHAATNEKSSLQRDCDETKYQLSLAKEELEGYFMQTQTLLSEREQVQLQVQQLTADKENLHSVVVQTTGLLTCQESRVNALMSELDQVQLQVQQLVADKENLHNVVVQTTGLLTSQESTICQLRETLSDRESDALRFSSSLSDLQSQLDDRNVALASVTESLKSKSSETEDLVAKLVDVEKELRAKMLEADTLVADLTEATAQNRQKAVEIEAMKAKLSEVNSQLHDQVAEMAELRDSVGSMHVTIADARVQINEKIEEINSLKNNVTDLLAQVNEIESDRKYMCDQNTDLTAKIAAKDKEFAECKNAYKLAKSKYDEGKVIIEDLRKEVDLQKKQLVDIEYLQDSVKKSTEALKKEKEMKISLLDQIQRTEQELNGLQTQYKKVTESQYQLSQQLADVQSDNAKLCGHQNSKQKIQAHLQLKKDITEQAQLVKQQQDRIVELTLERDAAKAELKKRKVVSKDQENIPVDMPEKIVADATDDSVALKRSRRVALKDASNQVK